MNQCFLAHRLNVSQILTEGLIAGDAGANRQCIDEQSHHVLELTPVSIRRQGTDDNIFLACIPV